MSQRIITRQAGEGTRLNTVDAVATVKVGAPDTDGQYELFEVVSPHGPGAPPHRHPWAEAYYVLDGEMIARVGGRRVTLGPGATITVPPNAAHSIEVSAASARFLVVSQTAGTGRLFADLDAAIPAGPPDASIVPLMIEVAERNGVSFVGQP